MILKVIVVKKFCALELYIDFSSKNFSSDTRRDLLVFVSFPVLSIDYTSVVEECAEVVELGVPL